MMPHALTDNEIGWPKFVEACGPEVVLGSALQFRGNRTQDHGGPRTGGDKVDHQARRAVNARTLRQAPNLTVLFRQIESASSLRSSQWPE